MRATNRSPQIDLRRAMESVSSPQKTRPDDSKISVVYNILISVDVKELIC